MVGFILETPSPPFSLEMLVHPSRRGYSEWRHSTCQPSSQLCSWVSLPGKIHACREERGSPRTLLFSVPLSLFSLPQQSWSSAGLGSFSCPLPSPPPQFCSPWAEQCSLPQKDSQRLQGSLRVQKISGAFSAN